jgi:Icc-related predicted phosphoesterase
MRIIAISDTHGLHDRITQVPDGDVLIHAGDFMNSGRDAREIRTFNDWLDGVRIKHRIVCAGNQDMLFERFPDIARLNLTRAVYLESSGIKIDGLSFWASPFTPEFLNWAFMNPRGDVARRYWDQIPNELDVLITHGPPYGILDQVTPGTEHLGCEVLRRAVEEKRPRVHVFGHIHGGAGVVDNGITRFVNAVYLNEQYRPLAPAGKIQIIDL